MSDHGEDLFDDAGNLSGHGNHPATPYVTQVPLFVWTSPRYHSAYPEKMENMRKNRHEEISADNMFYSILDMANIGYDGEDLSMSFASERFKTNARTFLTINGQLLNFDRFGQAN
jgi:glucan phosphoethanolaminetransferase (alkaline phosphatase superfamily)